MMIRLSDRFRPAAGGNRAFSGLLAETGELRRRQTRAISFTSTIRSLH